MTKTLTVTLALALAGMGITGAVAAPQRANMPTFENLDTNGDGVITQTELDAKQAAKFAENDLNGDGFLDAAELAGAAKGRSAKGPRGDADPAAMAAKIIARSDTDGDGKLSPAEAKPRNAGKIFARMDADGNGEITRAEWDAAIASRRDNN